MTGMPFKIVNQWRKLTAGVALSLFSSLASHHGFAGFAEDKSVNHATLNPPETELALAITDLENLQKAVKSLGDLNHQSGIGPQDIAAERAFNNARRFFEASEYLSVIRELNSYLNLSQVPLTADYLEAQRMLGRSYEQTGYRNRALRAYFRYLSTFLTAKSPDFDQLEDVLSHLLPLAANDTSLDHRELNEMLSSLMSLEVPEEAMPVVSMFAAQAAATSGELALAQNWLERTLRTTKVDRIRAKSMYLRALLDLARNNYDSAEHWLTEVLSQATQDTAETRDQAYLALARLSVRRKQPTVALKYYNKIDEVAPAFKDALFETIYLTLNLGDEDSARSKAKFFMTRYPNVPEAFQVQVLLSYLDLRAGDLGLAAEGIDASSAQLKAFDQWMTKAIAGQDHLTHAAVAELMATSKGLVDAPPIVAESYQQFAKLAEIGQRLGNAHGDVRNLIYTVGRLNSDALHPDWSRRTEQLQLVGESVLRIGHRLAALETRILGGRLSELQKQELSAAESRRTKFLTEPAKFRRANLAWSSFAGFNESTLDLTHAHDQLQQAEAQLAATRFLAFGQASGSNPTSATSVPNKLITKTPPKAAHVEAIRRAQEKISRLHEQIDRTLSTIRVARIEDFLNQSAHRSLKRLMSLYAGSINDDSITLASAREIEGSHMERLLNADLDRAWLLWKETAKSTYEEIGRLDGDIKTRLTQLVNELAKHEKRFLELSASLDSLTERLEKHMGRSLGLITDLYAHALDHRLSKNQKWKADIEWMRYIHANDQKSALAKRTDVEKQILNDNLRDLEQGAFWKWPEDQRIKAN